MSDLSPLAGLHVAPPYDKSKELDPSKVQALPPPFDLEKLEYFQKRQERRTWFARVTLLTSLLFLVGLDIWISTVHHEAAMAELDRSRDLQILNIDQARKDTVQLQELTEDQIMGLKDEIAALKEQLNGTTPSEEAGGQPANPQDATGVLSSAP